MLYYPFIAVELCVLFLTSKHLIQAVFAIFFRIFRRHTAAGAAVFTIFFPGVIVHELAHLLTAEVLFVRTAEFEVAPRIEGNSLKMGSVQVVKSDIFRSMLIGVAPILFGTVILLAVLFIYINYFISNLLIGLAVVWIVFIVTNTMFSSKKDLEGSEIFGLVLLFLLLVVAILFYLLKINPIPQMIAFLSESGIVENIKLASLLLLIPVAVNLVVFGAAKFIVKKIY